MGAFDGGHAWIGQWVGESPWEKHAAGDEFLHVLEDTVEVTLITGTGKKTIAVSQESIFVVPKNHWHRQKTSRPVTVLGATPGETEHAEIEPSFK